MKHAGRVCTPQRGSRLRLALLLLIAMCVHVSAATGAYLAGRWEVAPGTFDKTGLASFGSDSRVYLLQISDLQKILKEEGAVPWLRTPAPVHVKLYSLSFALFSPLFGATILSAEPLNLIYYLVILLLIFALGNEVFGAQEGLLAAAMCAALLPTLLLHTTQLLADPLFLVLALALVVASVKWLNTEYTLVRGLVAGALGGAAAASLWLVKNSTWWVVLAIMFLATALSLARQVRRRMFLPGNVAGVALMLAIALSMSHLVTPYWLPKEYWMPYKPDADTASVEKSNRELPPDSTAVVTQRSEALQNQQPPETLSSRVPNRVAKTRARFIELYPDAGSNLDSNVQFAGTADIVRYLPRAVLIGLFAPFPSMWFETGANTGRAGRVLSGCETVLMYFVMLLAFQSFWHRRRQLPVWFLMLTALIGVTALGLVVVNVGTLYRQRYLFWIIFIVMAADTGVRLIKSRLAHSPGGVGLH